MLSKWCVFLLFAGLGVAAAASPDITLAGLDGKDHHLGEYIGQGKWVLLNVWGPRCPPCLEEIPELVSFHEAHVGEDAMVVGMALDFPSFGYARRDEVARFEELWIAEIGQPIVPVQPASPAES